MIDLSALRQAARAKANHLAADLIDENARIERLKADRANWPLANNYWHKQHALQLRLRAAEAVEVALAEADVAP